MELNSSMAVSGLRKAFSPGKAVGLVAPAFLLILLLYFYVNGALVFGEFWGGFQNIILLYILILLGAFALAPTLLQRDPKAPFYLELAAYIGPAIGVNLILLIAGVRLQFGPVGGPVFAIIALQVAVSGSEEMFFRGALQQRFVLGKVGPGLAAMVSSGLFAGFHAVAYGLNPANLIFAFAAGVAFYIIYEQTRDQFGLAVNSGIHLGYNLGLLGISLIPFGLLAGFGA